MGDNTEPSPVPLTEEEIVNSLKRSGFPLEIRLLQAFDGGGFDPQPPHRYLLGEGDKERSAEVDLTARTTKELDGNRGLLLLTLMVEAKQVHERVSFVGFKWKQPTALEMRVGRMRFCGLPSCRVLHDDVNGASFEQLLVGGSTPVLAALDVLNEAPLCHHWCFVRAARGKPIEATQEEDMRHSFRKLVHATTWLERESARAAIRSPATTPMWRLEIKFPTIVIATPHLYTYDPLTCVLERTQQLTLREVYEVGGEIHVRYVDVVTENEVSNLMARYRRAANELCAAVDDRAYDVQTIVDEQRDQQQRLDNAELADSINTRW